jgi:hypothetical protein
MGELNIKHGGFKHLGLFEKGPRYILHIYLYIYIHKIRLKMI